jgi:hypothetical protein
MGGVVMRFQVAFVLRAEVVGLMCRSLLIRVFLGMFLGSGCERADRD